MDELLWWLDSSLVELLGDLLPFVATVSETKSERRERITASENSVLAAIMAD